MIDLHLTNDFDKNVWWSSQVYNEFKVYDKIVKVVKFTSKT